MTIAMRHRDEVVKKVKVVKLIHIAINVDHKSWRP